MSNGIIVWDGFKIIVLIVGGAFLVIIAIAYAIFISVVEKAKKHKKKGARRC